MGRFPTQNTAQEYSLPSIATASRQPILYPLHSGWEPGLPEWWINNIRKENEMEEALIQYISLLLIVAIFHSSPPSFQTAGIVTQLQQLTCSEERGVTLLGMTSLSLHKLHSSALCPSHMSFCRTHLPHLLDPCLVPGSHPQWTRTRGQGTAK